MRNLRYRSSIDEPHSTNGDGLAPRYRVTAAKGIAEGQARERCAESRAAMSQGCGPSIEECRSTARGCEKRNDDGGRRLVHDRASARHGAYTKFRSEERRVGKEC